MKRRAVAAIPFAVLLAATAAADCPAGPARAVLRLTGEVAAGETFAAPVGPWTFVLDPDPWGWTVRLRDAAGADLAGITPPFHFVPNPRELHGWHFRNAANTGPNEGDVNAPQHLRDFVFEATDGGDAPLEDRVRDAPGRGLVEITGFALTAPEPGGRARFTALCFAACLSWPKATP